MKQLLTFFLGLTATLYCSGQTNKLAYRFSYDTLTTTLTVQLQMTGTDSGKTYLQLPNAFANQKELYKAVTNLTIASKNATIDTTVDPSVRLLTHQPNTKLQITYQLKQDWSGPLIYPMSYRAVLQPSFIQLTGHALLAHPKMEEDAAVAVTLNWAALPAKWKIGNSLHALTRSHTANIKISELQNTLYTAGDFRSQCHTINGKPIYVFIRGTNWKFTDAELGKKLSDIIKTERQFWNDHTQPFYFVSLIPYQGEGTYNGSSMHQAFMLGMTEDFPLDVYVLRLLAHEYFHRWNGVEITMNGEEGENTWLSEGFTEYYTYKLLYYSGMISLPQYVEKANRIIADYYLSPVRNIDKVTAGKNFWASREYHQLPYNKGFTYALYLDHLIQSGSNKKYSLDHVMFDLAKASKSQQLISDSVFLHLVKQYAGSPIDSVHNASINKGITIPVAPQSLGASVTGSVQQLGQFEIGFDLEASWQAKQIVELKENSAAWKAGLRNGQTIKGYNISYDEINKPAEIKIEENGVIKKITYLPMSATQVAVPQFTLK